MINDLQPLMRIQAPQKNPQVKLQEFADQMKSPLFIAELLKQKGIHNVEEARNFFLAKEDALCDLHTFKNFKAVFDILLQIHEKQERILVHGDYDVDGVAGAAVLFRGLKTCGFNVEWFLPNRFIDGYGLTENNVQHFWDRGVRWIITVDTGISAVNEVKLANRLGMGVIITDHHQVGSQLPETPYIINPNQPGCMYPNKGLSGTGVAYKIIESLYHAIRRESPDSLLELVAVATLADMSPLTAENRYLVRQGLKSLQQGASIPGLGSLLEKAGLSGQKLSSTDILFKITPVINSAGRLDTPDSALELFLTEKMSRAHELSDKLMELNNKRKLLDQQVFTEANLKSQEFQSDVCLVLGSSDWHEGVIGIVAAKIVDRFHKPAFILSLKNGVGKGSCRTIEGVNLHKALSQCSDLLEKWGGHYHACGFSVLEENIDPLRQKLNEVIQRDAKDALVEKFFEPQVEVDLMEINEDSLTWLDRLEPTGPKNERPLFYTGDVHLYGDPRIVGGSHLKFSVTHQGEVFPVIGFGLAHLQELLLNSEKFNIAYYPEWNNFRGNRNIQLRVVAVAVETAP